MYRDALQSAPPDRSPPHSLEAEEHVIAVCLLDNGSTFDRAVCAGVNESSFYRPENRHVFATLLSMRRDEKELTLEILVEELNALGLLKQIGGFPYLIQVTGKIPTTAHAGYFIEKLRAKELLRGLIDFANGAIERAQHPIGDIQSELANARKQIEALCESNTSNSIACVSAAELCANPPSTPPEIVHGLIYRGGTGMISAPSKGHKTYTLLDMACAIALGRDWLGFKTTTTATLYVNLELAEHSSTRRLTAICAARGIKPPANLHVLNLRGKRTTAETLHNVIVPMARKLGAGLIIIDPYYKISSVSGVEENSNDGQALFLASVDQAAEKSQCAIIMVHHFAKGDAGGKNSIDRGSGGGVQARWPDVFATLTEHETEDCMVAEFHLRDFAPIPRFVVRWQCPVWTREDGEDPAKVKRSGRGDEHPASALLDKLPPEGLTTAEWVKAVGWSDGTYRRKRDELEQAGKVKCLMNLWKPC